MWFILGTIFGVMLSVALGYILLLTQKGDVQVQAEFILEQVGSLKDCKVWAEDYQVCVQRQGSELPLVFSMTTNPKLVVNLLLPLL